ncbi:AEC family transporter [Aliikangiella sp. IMCC44653]
MLNFALIGLFLALGALFNYRQWLPQRSSYWLNFSVIYVCLPAIVFIKLPQIEINANLLVPLILPWVLMLLIAAGLFFAAKVFHWSRLTLGCLLMVCCFGNTSFFGFPMVNAFLGENALSYAVIYDVMGSFLSLAILGNIVIVVFKQAQAPQTKINWFEILTKICFFPPLIAIVLVWALPWKTLPEWLNLIFVWLAHLLVPITMFLVGSHLRFKLNAKHRSPLMIGLGVKLLVMPCLAFLLIWLSGFNTSILAVQTSLFEAAMPPMVTASVMAIHADLEPKLAAAAVGFGLALSCITLPLWYWLIT